MLIDLHIHTSRHSWCSFIEAHQVIHRAIELGLNGIVLMEHDLIWTPEDIMRLKEQTGAKNLVVLRGQEISCNTKDGYRHGHLMTFGYYRTDHQQLSTGEVIAEVHKDGGIAIAAHPFRGGFGLGEDIYKLDIDGIEVFHPQHDEGRVLKAWQACHALNLPGLAGSDAHELAEIGSFVTYFPDTVYTEEELIREIKAKRCKPGPLKEFMSND